MLITRPWTIEGIAKLEKLADEGATLMRASAALRRPPSAVQKKARELGKPLPGVRKVRADSTGDRSIGRKAEVIPGGEPKCNLASASGGPA